MNFIEAVAIFESSALTSVRDTLAAEARQCIQAILDAYDALAPDWSQAPEAARYYMIDADGTAKWSSQEPEIVIGENEWFAPVATIVGATDLPLGIDWRLCKWERP